jgi:hypothetical protein
MARPSIVIASAAKQSRDAGGSATAAILDCRGAARLAMTGTGRPPPLAPLRRQGPMNAGVSLASLVCMGSCLRRNTEAEILRSDGFPTSVLTIREGRDETYFRSRNSRPTLTSGLPSYSTISDVA